MAQDKDRFYEDEELELEDDVEELEEDLPEEEGEPEEVNDMKYFMELMRCIRTAISNGKNIPFSGKKIVDAENCLQIIDSMEENLPDAVQYGMQMYAERERILGNAETTAMNKVTSAEMRVKAALEKAKADVDRMITDAENEANAIISEAQERADHMVQESEIVRQAREEARVIKNDARVEANELRLKASHDAYELLAAVEDELNEATKAVRRRRADLGDEAE